MNQYLQALADNERLRVNKTERDSLAGLGLWATRRESGFYV